MKSTADTKAESMTDGNVQGNLNGKVVAVAGAGGPAGRAALLRLAESGARVVAADAQAERLAESVDAARYAAGGADITGDIVDLLDPAAAREWADRTEKNFGRIDGLVHLVGGWRGSATFGETDLADWTVLNDLLIRTVQHTSLAFHDALLRSPAGRFVLISQSGAAKPTAGNAAYGAAKAAAEAWTLALADSFRRAGGDEGAVAAAVIIVIKALVHDEMRAQKPNAKFSGFTDVRDLAQSIVDVWNQPAQEVNGNRLWLTSRP
jgi:NAD(P)-dependent dehydrogenase (short-subunit alcohol dehydrogenase family)